MKTLFITFFALASFTAFASDVVININMTNGKERAVALNRNNEAYTVGSTYRFDNPTIKDFRLGNDYENYCYEGSTEDMKTLIESLVSNANGDGDSWAELKSIKTNAKKEMTVIAIITDESGENKEHYTFKPCKY